MIAKTQLIKVTNRAGYPVGYTIPDLGNLRRQYQPNETKEVPFSELERLAWTPGGLYQLKEELRIEDEAAARELFNCDPEPEYSYTDADIKRILLEGTLDEFLDFLDFAPEGGKEKAKVMAVELRLNDNNKREAIKDKLDFDVTNAIALRDSVSQADKKDEKPAATPVARRRVQPKQ